MKVLGKLVHIASALVLTVVSVCLFSGPYHETDASSPSGLILTLRKIPLSAGEFAMGTTDLTAVLQSGETAVLGEFPLLKSADLSGSACYQEIIDWSAAHPEVSVRYTVALPTGQTVDGGVTELDLSGISSEQIAPTAQLLAYLPQLKSVELGAATEAASLSGSDLNALFTARSDIAFDYDLYLLGKQVSLYDASVDISSITAQDVEDVVGVLSCMSKLAKIELGSDAGPAGKLGWENIALLAAACPSAELNYSFTVFGQQHTLNDEELNLSHIAMGDEGALVRQVIACMPKLKTLDMDYCGVSTPAMAGIREDFPNVNVIWRIWFGEKKYYSVRTDAERILASKASVAGFVTDADGAELKYCTALKRLDLGHNEGITDLSFLSGMKELEILILSMNPFTDISPIANCTKLEYLELLTTNISDLSPLAGLTELRHLNLQNDPYVTDITPLYGLTSLERLWIGAETPVPAEQVAEMQSRVPDCKINTTVYANDQSAEGWRFTRYDPAIPKYYWSERYGVLREEMGYNTQEFSFYWLDPLCGDPAPAKYAGMFGAAASA